MASIIKHKEDTYYYIRHSLRELPVNKSHSNKEIDPARQGANYSIIKRGRTAKEINTYRKTIEKQLYHINRKGLVKCLELVVTLPSDCQQEREFFTECVNFVGSTIVPMDAVFLAEVHKDEGVISDNGVMAAGRPHIHIMFVPAVKNTKHPNYQYKLCADALTRKKDLKMLHPNLQSWMDKAGIKASVHTGATGGKNIPIKELKALTRKTGLTLEAIKELEKTNNILKDGIQVKDAEYQKLRNATIKALSLKDQQISEYQKQNEALQSQVKNLQAAYLKKQHELSGAIEKIKEFEAAEIPPKDTVWGHSNNAWGEKTQAGWGHTDHRKTHTEERTW